MKETLQKAVNAMEKGLDKLKIEKLVGGREEQQTLTVRSISKNHTQE